MKMRYFYLLIFCLCILLPGCTSSRSDGPGGPEGESAAELQKDVLDRLAELRESTESLKSGLEKFSQQKESLWDQSELSGVMKDSSYRELKDRREEGKDLFEASGIIAEFSEKELKACRTRLDSEDELSFDELSEVSQAYGNLKPFLIQTKEVLEKKEKETERFWSETRSTSESLMRPIRERKELLEKALVESEPYSGGLDEKDLQRYRKLAEETFAEAEEIYAAFTALQSGETNVDQPLAQVRELLTRTEAGIREVDERLEAVRAERSGTAKAFFETVRRAAFSDSAFNRGQEASDKKFRGAASSAEWEETDFSKLAEFCKSEHRTLKAEYLPLMNLFEIGTPTVESSEKDNGWVYHFRWAPNDGRDKSDVFLTVTVDRSGISLELTEGGLFGTDETEQILEKLRFGVIQWSFSGEDDSSDLQSSVPLFQPISVTDTLVADDSIVSMTQRLKSLSVLSELNLAAEIEPRLEYYKPESCPLKEDYKDGNIQLSKLEREGICKAIFLTTLSTKGADDLMVKSMTFINDVPTQNAVEFAFNNSGYIEMVAAEIQMREADIANLETAITPTSNARSSNPYEAQRIFRGNQSIVKHNRNINSRIRRLETQISRLDNSINVQLKKMQKKADNYFRTQYFVCYRIYLKDKKNGGEYLLCESKCAPAPSGGEFHADEGQESGLFDTDEEIKEIKDEFDGDSDDSGEKADEDEEETEEEHKENEIA